jgi:hypothetical protein
MALFIILPFIILQKMKHGPVEPSVRKVPINAARRAPGLPQLLQSPVR